MTLTTLKSLCLLSLMTVICQLFLKICLFSRSLLITIQAYSNKKYPFLKNAIENYIGNNFQLDGLL